MAGEITADYDSVFAYDLDIFPADFYILISAHKTEAFAPAPYNNGHKTPTAGVYFHITDTTQPAPGFSTYDLFVSQVCNTAVHSITPFMNMMPSGRIMSERGEAESKVEL